MGGNVLGTTRPGGGGAAQMRSLVTHIHTKRIDALFKPILPVNFPGLAIYFGSRFDDIGGTGMRIGVIDKRTMLHLDGQR